MSNFRHKAFLQVQRNVSTVIERDLPCCDCGYNLRGLKYGQNCPECGTTIERKRADHSHIMDASAGYLKMLRIGMGLVSLGLWVPFIANFAVQNPSLISQSTTDQTALAGKILLVLGGWLITRQKPNTKNSPRPTFHLANITRAALILMPVLFAIHKFTSFGNLDPLIDCLSTLVTYAVLALLAYFFSDLARWACAEVLARRFEILVGIFVLIGVLDSAARLSGSTISKGSSLEWFILFAAIVWYFVSVLALFGTVNRAVADKKQHDDSIFRDPSKKIK